MVEKGIRILSSHLIFLILLLLVLFVWESVSMQSLLSWIFLCRSVWLQILRSSCVCLARAQIKDVCNYACPGSYVLTLVICGRSHFGNMWTYMLVTTFKLRFNNRYLNKPKSFFLMVDTNHNWNGIRQSCPFGCFWSVSSHNFHVIYTSPLIYKINIK